MRVEFAAVDAEFGPAEHERRMCFTKFRFLPTWLKEEIRRDGLWDDLVQETYATAWEAWQQGLSEKETYRLMGRRTYAFLRAYGYRVYRHYYYKTEKPLSSIAKDEAHGEKVLAKAAVSPARTFMGRDNLGEKIMALLRETPDGMSKRDLYSCLCVSARELDWHCRPLIEQGLVVEVKRENRTGRYPTPLLVAVQPGLPLPSMGTDKMERIRQAYFAGGKSIKQIAREFRHHRRTVRKAIYQGLDLPGKERKRIVVTEDELRQLIMDWAIAKGGVVTDDDFDSVVALLEEHHLGPEMANLEKARKALRVT